MWNESTKLEPAARGSISVPNTWPFIPKSAYAFFQ